MKDKFLTLGKVSECIYKVKGSKFLAFAYPVSTEEAIKLNLGNLRTKYCDARQHCYAYMLGKDQKNFRANDDGEPNHSAGDPILGQIRSHGLTNVLIVVVRYFGGTKLGIGGLIKAYKSAAGEAIATNVIVERALTEDMSFSFDYGDTNEVMRIIAMYDMQITSQRFQSICEISIRCQKSMLKEANHLFVKISSFKVR